MGLRSLLFSLGVSSLGIGLAQQPPIKVETKPSPLYKEITPQTFDNPLEGFKSKDIYPDESEPLSPYLANKPASQEERSAQVEKVIRNQLQEFRKLDLSKAYYAFMSKDFQKTIPDIVFKAYVRKNPVLYRNEVFNIESVASHDELVTVKGKLSASDGQAAFIQYDLIREDGDWKIRKIDVTPDVTSRLKRKV